MSWLVVIASVLKFFAWVSDFLLQLQFDHCNEESQLYTDAVLNLRSKWFQSCCPWPQNCIIQRESLSSDRDNMVKSERSSFHFSSPYFWRFAIFWLFMTTSQRIIPDAHILGYKILSHCPVKKLLQMEMKAVQPIFLHLTFRFRS